MVTLQLSPVKSVLKGKRVVVVDDSIVRGTTSSKIVRLLKEAGATEVHMRISSPPITGSCYYGVDTPRYGLRNQLLVFVTHFLAKACDKIPTMDVVLLKGRHSQVWVGDFAP